MRRTMSLMSVVAGVLTALGVVAIALGVAGAADRPLGVRSSGFSVAAWRHMSAGDAVVVAVVAFVALALGGYTAGRMSRRAGARHGVAVFVVAVAAAAVAVVSQRDLGDWSHTAQVSAMAGAAAMFVGACFGGLAGARWHRRFDSRVEADREREREREVEAERPRPKRALGDDPTMDVDLTEADRQPSIEEERELRREGHEAVGL